MEFTGSPESRLSISSKMSVGTTNLSSLSPDTIEDRLYDEERIFRELIPINFDNSYTVKVNNKDVKYEANVYNLVSIPIEKGQNKIEIKYLPKLYKEGIIISIITLLTLLFFIFTNKKIKYLDQKIILNLLFLFTSIIGIAFILKIYILFWL